MAAFLIPVVFILVTLPEGMHDAMGCGHVPVLPPQRPTPGSFLDQSQVSPLLEV